MSHINLSFSEFHKLASQGKYDMFPLCMTLINEQLSPVTLFSPFQSQPYSFLMESASTQHEHSRYSIMGINPDWVLNYQSGCLNITNPQGEISSTQTNEAMQLVHQHLQSLAQSPYVDSQFPQLLGCFGYAGYSMVHHFEPSVPSSHTPELPEMLWIIPQLILIFDHHKHLLHLVTPCYLNFSASLQKTYDSALQVLTHFKNNFLNNDIPVSAPQPQLSINLNEHLSDFQSEWDKDNFIQAIQTAQSYIEQGDIFQVVISQKFKKETPAQPFSIYRALRHLNPSPYMFYLNTPDFALTGASPETMIRCDNNKLYLKPIAGTRPRGRTLEEDERYAHELLADPKEIAEHIMLVDLGRNDLGRVCSDGSIHIYQDQFKIVEKYSHVMHIVSQLTGDIDLSCYSLFDALIASFPAGTLSGAPKIRAMQIIDQLEPSSRDAYGGVFGYITFDQRMDTCIIIRSVILQNGVSSIQAGAGIVYDSSPIKEYEETIHKASAVFQAILMAEHESFNV